MVNAATGKLDGCAFQQQSFLDRPWERPDAEWSFNLIEHIVYGPVLNMHESLSLQL
jgi:hypothetical protein